METATERGEVDNQVAALLERLRGRDFTVGIIGLGYVGLPLALAFAEKGFRVVGFDVDEGKIATLRNGGCYIRHLDGGQVARAVAEGRIQVTADFERLDEPDALLICVPTPIDGARQPNLSYVDQTAAAITRRLRTGQLVILESTTYPGTTEERLLPILEKSDLVCGRDFFLAFSPEREDPGNVNFQTTALPKVVGGVGRAGGDLAQALYGKVFDKTVRVSSAATAEATKLMENIFRAVNIALVNELKTVYDPMGIDIWEVLDAAATKPFGFMRFTPGPGWGGHCIPVDPFYLSWKASQHGQRARFIELAGEVNREMPRYVLGKLEAALKARGTALAGCAVLVLGIAYKPDIDDPRESPAFEIIHLLLDGEAKVDYHDPHIAEAPRMRTWPDLPPMRSVALTPENLASYDAVLIITDHQDLDYDLVAANASLVIDTRGVYRGALPPTVMKA